MIRPESRFTYSKLYNEITTKFGHRLSHRDYAYCLHEMKNKNVLNKLDNGIRGTTVHYSLTEKARIQNQLRILKFDEDFERRRSLYQVLLYFHSFKRGEVLSERQLHYKLSKMALKFEDLKKLDDGIARHLEGRAWTFNDDDQYTQTASYTNSSKNISIVRYVKGKKNEDGVSKNVIYYLFTVGFTKEEFIMYMRKLKKRKEPRPFSKRPPLIPYVYHTSYTNGEIEKAIELFYDVRLIKSIPPVFQGEIRFSVSDTWVIDAINIIRQIQDKIFSLIMSKMSKFGPPSSDEIRFLELFFGKRTTGLAVNKANEIRKDLTKNNDKKVEKRMDELETQIFRLLRDLHRTYDDHFKSNELLGDLITNFAGY